jgi:hypothetical protein
MPSGKSTSIPGPNVATLLFQTMLVVELWVSVKAEPVQPDVLTVIVQAMLRTSSDT